MLIGLSAALVAAVLYGTSAIFQASGSRSVRPASALDFRLLFQLLRSRSFDLSLVMTLSGFVFHLIALRSLPLFLAQSGIAASLAVTAVLAVVVFHESLNGIEWTAVGGVVAALALLGLAAGTTGSDRGSTGLTLTIIGALVTALVVAGLSRWMPPGVAAGVLGLMAGVGYAAAGVSARILPSLTLGALASSPATYLLAASGTIAFFLYSVALQRGSVTVATAPMIAAQTILPSIAGLVLLGDTVRSGWWWALILGFGVAAVAVGVLVRAEARRGVTMRMTEATAFEAGEQTEPA